MVEFLSMLQDPARYDADARTRLTLAVLEEFERLPTELRDGMGAAVARFYARMQAKSHHEDMARYQDDFKGYCRDIHGVDLTDEQAAVAVKVRTSRRIICKASHAVGKSFVAALLACWWYDCWDQSIVYITAPTWKQALGLTFKYVKRFRWQKKLPGVILESGIVKDEDPFAATGHFIQALNAEKGEGFQGEHTSPILIIIEEGVGVPTYIWEATEGLMTSPSCRAVSIGNPVDEATRFGENASSPDWDVISIAAMDHPNMDAEMHGQPPPFPGAVRLLWLYEQMKRECVPAKDARGDNFRWWALPVVARALDGHPLPPALTLASQPDDSPLIAFYRPNAFFQGRVLGVFPSVPDEQVIPAGWLRDLPAQEPKGEPAIGVDVARFGTDRTAIACVQGPVVWALHECRQLDNLEVAGAIKLAAMDLFLRTGVPPKRIAIKIDVTGGLGTGPFDLLKAEGYRVVDVNASETAFEDEYYELRRDELWFMTRDVVQREGLDTSRLDPDLRQLLHKELSAPKWKPSKRGRKQVTPKVDMKKDLGYSPDLADALNLAYHPPLARGALHLADPDALDLGQGPIEKRTNDLAELEQRIRASLPEDVAQHLGGLLGLGF